MKNFPLHTRFRSGLKDNRSLRFCYGYPLQIARTAATRGGFNNILCKFII